MNDILMSMTATQRSLVDKDIIRSAYNKVCEDANNKKIFKNAIKKFSVGFNKGIYKLNIQNIYDMEFNHGIIIGKPYSIVIMIGIDNDRTPIEGYCIDDDYAIKPFFTEKQDSFISKNYPCLLRVFITPDGELLGELLGANAKFIKMTQFIE